VIGFVPQFIAWQVVYGSPVTVPQGPDFIHWFEPQFGMLLFSRWYGLLTWTPLCGIGILGLFFCPKEHRRVYAALGAALLAQLYVNACLHEAGWTFGMRRMSNCAPLFAAGIAALMWRAPGRLLYKIPLVAVFVFWNFLFVLQFSGFIDGVYIDRAFAALAEEQGITVEELADLEVLPDGTPFDAYFYAYTHAFPRGGGPSWQQMYGDKGIVLHMLASKTLGLPPPK
jgi:hypothetical protein